MKARDCFAIERAMGGHRFPFAMVIEDFVDIAICDELAQRIDALNPEVAPVTTHRGPVMRLDIRNNERVIFEDAALAQSLFERIASLVPEELEGEWPQTTKRAAGERPDDALRQRTTGQACSAASLRARCVLAETGGA